MSNRTSSEPIEAHEIAYSTDHPATPRAIPHDGQPHIFDSPAVLVRPLAGFTEVADQATAQITDRAHEVVDRAQKLIGDVKPHLRGWLHAATAPLALAILGR